MVKFGRERAPSAPRLVVARKGAICPEDHTHSKEERCVEGASWPPGDAGLKEGLVPADIVWGCAPRDSRYPWPTLTAAFFGHVGGGALSGTGDPEEHRTHECRRQAEGEDDPLLEVAEANLCRGFAPAKARQKPGTINLD